MQCVYTLYFIGQFIRWKLVIDFMLCNLQYLQFWRICIFHEQMCTFTHLYGVSIDKNIQIYGFATENFKFIIDSAYMYACIQRHDIRFPFFLFIHFVSSLAHSFCVTYFLCYKSICISLFVNEDWYMQMQICNKKCMVLTHCTLCKCVRRWVCEEYFYTVLFNKVSVDQFVANISKYPEAFDLSM